MKKNILTQWLFAALLLVSSVAVAEQKYPGADFEPVIIYQNSDYISKNSPPPAPAAPAATPAKQETSSSSSAPAPAAAAPAAPVKTETAEAKPEKPDDLSMGSYQAGLIILALLALAFWSFSPKPEE